MGRSDIIADSFTIIRNGYSANKESVVIPYSKTLMAICEVLKEKGYIGNYAQMEEGRKKYIKVYLKYSDTGRPAVMKIKRISKPSRRYYIGAKQIKPVLNSKGVSILTTSKGIITGAEAKKQGIGGEVICYVW
jgi:small subunit ribosomal protein S8